MLFDSDEFRIGNGYNDPSIFRDSISFLFKEHCQEFSQRRNLRVFFIQLISAFVFNENCGCFMLGMPFLNGNKAGVDF